VRNSLRDSATILQILTDSEKFLQFELSDVRPKGTRAIGLVEARLFTMGTAAFPPEPSFRLVWSGVCFVIALRTFLP